MKIRKSKKTLWRIACVLMLLFAFVFSFLPLLTLMVFLAFTLLLPKVIFGAASSAFALSSFVFAATTAGSFLEAALRVE